MATGPDSVWRWPVGCGQVGAVTLSRIASGRKIFSGIQCEELSIARASRPHYFRMASKIEIPNWEAKYPQPAAARL